MDRENNAIYDMNDSYYHSLKHVSQSMLKELKKSPRHLYEKFLAENREQIELTDAMKLGTAVHMYILEKDKFNANYVVSPAFDKRTIAGKKQLADFTQENNNKTIITNDEFLILENIEKTLKSKETFKKFVKNGNSEVTLLFTDKATNLDCKARLDYFVEPNQTFKNGLIIDLKTTINAQVSEFAKAIDNFSYYNQAAFYCEAVKTVYETDDYPLFIFIAIEKVAPFEISFVACDDEMLSLGLIENRKLLNKFKECQEQNNWQGYNDKLEVASLPGWAVNRIKNGI